MPDEEHCDVDEYLNDDVPICMEAVGDNWESEQLEQLGEVTIGQADEPQASGEDDEVDVNIVTQKFKSIKEAKQSIDNIQEFLGSKGYNEKLKIGLNTSNY